LGEQLDQGSVFGKRCGARLKWRDHQAHRAAATLHTRFDGKLHEIILSVLKRGARRCQEALQYPCIVVDRAQRIEQGSTGAPAAAPPAFPDLGPGCAPGGRLPDALLDAPRSSDSAGRLWNVCESV
jgi:hypothetical protein